MRPQSAPSDRRKEGDDYQAMNTVSVQTGMQSGHRRGQGIPPLKGRKGCLCLGLPLSRKAWSVFSVAGETAGC